MVRTRSGQCVEKSKNPDGILPHTQNHSDVDVASCPGSCKSPSIASSSGSIARRALKIAQLHEARIKREVELERSLLEAREKVELAQIDVDFESQSAGENHSESSSVSKVNDYLSKLSIRPNRVQPPLTSEVPMPSTSIASIHQESKFNNFVLPKVEMMYFHGDPSTYCLFLRQLEVYIERAVTDESQRLLFLLHYCKGEARNVIEECIMLPPATAYLKAKKILRDMFGQPHVVARCTLESLMKQVRQSSTSSKSLSELSNRMRSCQLVFSELSYASELNSVYTLESVVRSLPVVLRHKWAEMAEEIRDTGRDPSFDDLSEFIDQRARIARSNYGQLAQEVVDNRPNPRVLGSKRDVPATKNSFLLSTRAPDQQPLLCSLCKQEHGLADCEQFLSLSVQERWSEVKNSKACFVCLKHNHQAKSCDNVGMCGVDGCVRRHHVLLHANSNRSDRTPSGGVHAVCSTAVFPKRLGIVALKVATPKGVVKTNAFLDLGSDVTLISSRFVHEHSIPVSPAAVELNSIGGQRSCDSFVSGLQLYSIDDSETVEVDQAFLVDKLPMRAVKSLNDIASSWPHLMDINFNELREDDVTILIGCDTTEAHWVMDQRLGGKKQPYAVRTIFGWVMFGLLKHKPNDKFSSNCICRSDRDINEQLIQLFNTEFEDTSNTSVGRSSEDIRALTIAESSIQLIDGHYQLKLPWKDETPRLENNKGMAERRLRHLRRRLLANSDLLEKYNAVIQSYVEKAYIEKTETRVSETLKGLTWYLPHHPVFNPKKPGKLRIVFDCAAKCNGFSLNDRLLQGPNTTANLVHVLLRFRWDHVAVAADIEEMFLQVKVDPQDRSALRFLYWDDQDMSKEAVEYQWSSHPFGATSSPFCAAFALRRTFEDFGSSFSIDVRESVDKSFYVDDCLKSMSDSDTAVRFVLEMSDLLSRGGFRLRNWTSNKREVIATIPVSERAPGVRNLIAGSLPLESALGMRWDTEVDDILIDFNLPLRPATRRGMLSCVSTLYDPLGLVAPWLVPGKCLLQSTCKTQWGWDEPFTGELKAKWDRWLSSVQSIAQIRIPRCVKPPGPDASETQLHVFSDASELAYGAVAYVRFVSSSGRIVCSLLYAKSRVAPIKPVSIPRLELNAATLAARIGDQVLSGLLDYVTEKYFWTDSTIVLYYIKNTTSRFSTFVSNRLGVIHDLTDVDRWRHVPTEDNPADVLSRGARDMHSLPIWLHGPRFLAKPEMCWPPDFKATQAVGIETKRSGVSVNLVCQSHALPGLFARYSCWMKLQRAVAWLLRVRRYLSSKAKASDSRIVTGNLQLSEIREACHSLIRMAQSSAFKEELRWMNERSAISSCGAKRLGRLRTLCPVLINNILCVGGRLQYSHLPEGSKHPMILPKNHLVTPLIVRYYHVLEGHSGVSHVLSVIRQKYWIIDGASTVKRLIGNCSLCKRRSARPCAQMMSPLPLDRVDTGWYPFKCVGIDIFGPFKIKRGRGLEKRYGCVFTCLQIRAVHIEMVSSLTTDAFIQAIIRFMARRGRPTDIYSDNGTNFVGAVNELKVEFKKMDSRKISDKLLSLEIQWHFNPPDSSHRGGIWERMIRSIRKLMLNLAEEQHMTEEQLQTLVTEIERILNNRPLVPPSMDCKDQEPLSPNHLLSMRIHQGITIENDLASRYRTGWKQVNYLAGVFWRRWTNEYLPTLQRRTKWLRSSREIRCGELVLIVSDSIPRNQWPLGVIEDLIVSKDGLVRTVIVKTAGGRMTRDIRKICLLEGSN